MASGRSSRARHPGHLGHGGRQVGRWRRQLAADRKQARAEFAFALLNAADPGDLGPAPPPSPYPTEGAALLASFPPPAARAVQGTLGTSPLANRVVRHLGDPGLDSRGSIPRRESSFYGATPPSRQSRCGSPSPSSLLPIRNTLSPRSRLSRSLERVRMLPVGWPCRPRVSRRRQRTASALAAKIRPQHRLGRSFSTIRGGEAAAIAEDLTMVLEATSAHGEGDALVDVMRVRALWVSDREEEALTLALRLLGDHPNRALTGGLALEAARLLLARAQTSGRSIDATGEAERARQLALEVRDLRRQWQGPSEEPAVVAAAAAGWLRDFDAAIRFAVEPPDGEAISREARDGELLAIAAVPRWLSATALARQLAELLHDPTERLLIQADALSVEGIRGQETTTLLVAALATATGAEQRFRAYMGLASAGVWPLEGLEKLRDEDSEAAAIVQATAEIVSGDIERGTRVCGPFEPHSTALTVKAYVDSDRIDDAVGSLWEAAQRFNRPQFRLQSADAPRISRSFRGCV